LLRDIGAWWKMILSMAASLRISDRGDAIPACCQNMSGFRRAVIRPRNREMRGLQRLRPAVAQVLEIEIARFDAVLEFDLQGIAFQDHDVDRQSDRKVRAHG